MIIYKLMANISRNDLSMSSYVEKTRTASQMRRVILRKVNRVLKKQGKRQMSKFQEFTSKESETPKLLFFVISRTFLITEMETYVAAAACVHLYRKSSLIRTYENLICFN